MLTITANGTPLVLPHNVQIQVTEVNPTTVFDDFSRGANFGLSPENKSRIKAPNRMGVKRVPEYDIELMFKSYRKNAIMKLIELGDETYSASLVFDLFIFYSRLKNTSIRQLTLGGPRDYASYPNTPNNFRKSSDESNFVLCKVYNTSFMDGTAGEANYKATNNYQNNDGYSPFFSLDHPRTPFIYLCYLYEQIFIEHGYSIKRNALREDASLKKIVLFSNQSSIDALGTLNLGYHLPNVTIPEFLNQVSFALNVHPLINESTKTVDIVWLEEKYRTPDVIDITQYVSGDIKKVISEDPPTKFEFKTTVLSADARQSQHLVLTEQEGITINAAVGTVAGLPLTDDLMSVRLVTAGNMYYRYEMDSAGVTAWKPYTINIQPYIFGAGDTTKSIETSFGFIQKQWNGQVEMQGNSYYRMNRVEVPLMMAMAVEANGTLELSHTDYILELTPEGIFEKCWKTTANTFINSNAQVEVSLRLPAPMLKAFDFSKLYKIYSTIVDIEALNYNLEAEQITYPASKLRVI